MNLCRFMNSRPKPGHAYVPTEGEHLANMVTHGVSTNDDAMFVVSDFCLHDKIIIGKLQQYFAL